MKIIIAFLLSVISCYCFSQTKHVKQKARNFYFYTAGYTEVSTKESADIIQMITEPDAGETLYPVQEFYKSGKKNLSACHRRCIQ